MFEPTEFDGGPRNGETVPHGELPGILKFPEGIYRLSAPNSTTMNGEILPDITRMVYVWQPYQQF